MDNYNDDMVVFESTQMFSVPSVITDKYINAGYNELRLILLLLRNSNMGFSKKTLMNRLSVDEKELSSAFEYWIREGVLFKQGDKYVLERPRVRSTDIMNYSAEDISERIDQDTGIRFLYGKTEEILAKPLTTSDASAVLSLVDWVGLPPDVVALMIQYCADSGKKSLRQIEKTGIEWAEKEINTCERAENFIESERKKRETIGAYRKVIGITDRALTDGEKKVFKSWSENMGYGSDIIAVAFNATVSATGKYSYQYMDKIISNWFKQGIKTSDDAVRACEEGKPKVKSGLKRYGAKKNNFSNDDSDAFATSWAIITNELAELGKDGNETC